MPMLFISYKRGTSAVAPLMDKLRAAHYRLWFDRDDIHLGDPDWQARIDDGLMRCDGVILNITPAACTSEPIRYEVRKARELGKPIFPIIVERVPNIAEALTQLGLSEKQHVEDFTDVPQWDAQIERLLRDLETQGLRVTRHDRRQQRDRHNPAYVLHQTYLKRVVERVGTLSLAQIAPEGSAGIALERVYMDSPTGLGLSVEIDNWQVQDWWLGEYEDIKLWEIQEEKHPRRKPQDWGYERAPLEALLSQVDAQVAAYRAEYPDEKPDELNGTKRNIVQLHLNHLAAARDRLVILGAPGSGKSTFVKHLALCLAGAGLDDWSRDAHLGKLDNWAHGALTPVYVELRRFVASAHFPADIHTPPTAEHLWAYIQHELLGAELRAYADDLRYDLEHGHALLILDGLDEVPYPEGKLAARQQQLIGLAHSLNTRYTSSRILVASRPYAYAGWTLPNFQAVTIRAFEDEHRVALADKLYRAAGLDAESAPTKARALNQQLQPIDAELKDRPLFVTLMATLYLQGTREGLPTRRGALYRESILLLLDRWTQGKAGAPSLLALLGDKTLDDLYARLAALAYDVHLHYGEQQGTPEIAEGQLYAHLQPLGRKMAAELIPYLSENAGVLVSPGQNAQRDVFHFAHRTFQEYLAAAHLVTLCAEADSFSRVREHITDKPQVWRVPCTLVGDVLADTERRGDLWGLLGELLENDPPQTGADMQWWLVWLAGTISTEQKLYEQEKLNRRTEQPVRETLIEWLLTLIRTPQALAPVERAACGRALSLLGDPRKGVGVIVRDGVTLPDIDWVDIPAPPNGKFMMGADDHKNNKPREVTLDYDFQMARYPITYKQFQAFLDDPEGFHDARWWQGLAHPTDHNAAPHDQAFKYWNHPRERVSWYDAIAFCRWLSWRLGGGYDLDKVGTWALRLPMEQEWEYAACGTDGREYPYIGDFDAGKGNTSETGIGQTSAVGIFPDGASPFGVLDMSGNVWDWCLTDLFKPAARAAMEALTTDEIRVSRGGSCVYDYSLARAVYRFYGTPSSRDIFRGFRLVRAKG